MVNAAQILLVEDNLADQRLMMEALREHSWINSPHVVSDGAEALEYLNGQGPYQNSPRPDLILLDLNLPRMDGREFLTRVKRDPVLRKIPVIVLSSSQWGKDISDSYALGADGYLTKPDQLNAYTGLLDHIRRCYLTALEFQRLPAERWNRFLFTARRFARRELDYLWLLFIILVMISVALL